MTTELEVTEGMRFDKGYISPYFATDTERMEAVLDEPYILLTDKKIALVQDLVPVLAICSKTGTKSCTKAIFLSVKRIYGSSRTASILSVSVAK